jgi:uncharacterized Zn finger protein (UPF0148 family)
MWWGDADDTVQDGDPCPYCGAAVLEVYRGEAECPNCGSVFEEG